MENFSNLLGQTILQVTTTFLHNWPFLMVSVLIAVGLKLYVNPEKVSAFLMRYRKVGVVGATVAAVATPLCSCGTTAVVLGMMANMIPWAPIIAFMVASPLTSPEELIYSAGLFGWPFALAFFVSSIVLGLLGGLIGDIFERRGWLLNQSRFSAPPAARGESTLQTAPSSTCACDATPAPVIAVRPGLVNRSQTNRPASVSFTSAVLVGDTGVNQANFRPVPVISQPEPCSCSKSLHPDAKTCACESQMTTNPVEPDCGCESDQAATVRPTVTWRAFLVEALSTGKRLLVMFLGFAFIGYFLNGLIPSEWVARVFGPGNTFSVPLAATLGLPLYINSEASLPLVRALIDGGMSQGAAMAFLITGAGTSIGALAGALTIARWRVIAIVIGTLWVGAIAMGYLVDILKVSGHF